MGTKKEDQHQSKDTEGTSCWQQNTVFLLEGTGTQEDAEAGQEGKNRVNAKRHSAENIWKVCKIFLSASVSRRAEPRRFCSRCRTDTFTSLKTLLVLFPGVCGRKINPWQGQIYWFLYSHCLVLPPNTLVPKFSSCGTSLLIIQKPSLNHTWTHGWPCSNCHRALVLAFIDRHELAFGIGPMLLETWIGLYSKLRPLLSFSPLPISQLLTARVGRTEMKTTHIVQLQWGSYFDNISKNCWIEKLLELHWPVSFYFCYISHPSNTEAEILSV